MSGVLRGVVVPGSCSQETPAINANGLVYLFAWGNLGFHLAMSASQTEESSLFGGEILPLGDFSLVSGDGLLLYRRILMISSLLCVQNINTKQGTSIAQGYQICSRDAAQLQHYKV